MLSASWLVCIYISALGCMIAAVFVETTPCQNAAYSIAAA
jgi:hypothetical protein